MQGEKRITPFMRYLDSLGDERAAELLQTKRRTVKAWRLGDRTPRPQEARAIVSRAPVTLDDIYGLTTEERARALEDAAALLRGTAPHAGSGSRRQVS